DDRAIEVWAGFTFLSRLARQRARNDDRIGRHLAPEYFPGLAIDDPGRGADENPHGKHRALAHDHAFGNLRARADEAIVFQDDRSRLQRLEHTADAGAAGDVTVLADLRAGADRGPGVDHGAGIQEGAEMAEARHHPPAGGDIGRASPPAVRPRAQARVSEACVGPAVEFRRDLVPPRCLAGPAGDQAHVVEAEREQHRLFEPLVDSPIAVAFSLVHTSYAAVEQIERGVDGLAYRALGRRSDAVAPLESVVDGFGKLGM